MEGLMDASSYMNRSLLDLAGNGTVSELVIREIECLLQSQDDVRDGRKLCPRLWDGLLCWPPTKPGTLVSLPCFEELNGIKYDTSKNATRWCERDLTWDNATNYTACHNLVVPPDEELGGVEVTTAIYFVGYTLSLVALTVAVWLFLYFKDLKCLRNTIHTNLMSSYILADFMWILTLQLQVSGQSNIHFCAVLIILLHYFHLTNFFWMFVEGLYLYILVVETFNRKHIKLRAYIFIGWGAPLIFILVWAIAKAADEFNHKMHVEGDQRHCPWMTQHLLDWIFQGPALAVLAINLIFLAMIMWVLITKLRSANTLETQQYRKATKALIVLIPLLGVTYILFIAWPSEGVAIYTYCRALLLSLQGFTVALFYCFLNTEVQNTIRHHWETWRESRDIGANRRYWPKDWSPNTRTDSISSHHVAPIKRESTASDSHLAPQHYNKRESTISNVTTLTVYNGSGLSLRPPLSPHRDVEIL
ncbi:diuretic hormone receptor-like isoform X2 [Macrosteles quadrilineatus]|uniref:diuretic hormone receptor-like isoform X2 n=1 Tax=Macrosteles quadrilineatus TaxID=74068 RepID=UPI0023E264B7|nr:diuretic hormone receptor-like isoform X2 [Macrosteles quadrilineatus]